jgi:hypothetical protein
MNGTGKREAAGEPNIPQKILDPVNRRMTRAWNGKPMRHADSHRKTAACVALWAVFVG